MSEKKPYLQIDSRDNIVVAIQDLSSGMDVSISGHRLVLQEDVSIKHKFSLHDFKQGDDIIMYGVLVGKATKNIPAGCAITTENIKHASSEYAHRKGHVSWNAPDVSKWKDQKFMGYHRSDGKVGTANYWIVFALTFCENRNLEVIESTLTEALGYQTKKKFTLEIEKLISAHNEGVTNEDLSALDLQMNDATSEDNRVFKNVDGIKVLRHDGGCGGTREDAQALCNLLAGYLMNPNVAGGTVLSLGCQNAEMRMLNEALDKWSPGFDKPVYFLEQQQSKNERAFIEEAVKKTFIGLRIANQGEREPASLDKLTLGLECGGSDGLSGITANPALGYTSDLLAALGGAPVLSEFPELNGVEQELMDRCVEEDDANRFASLMKAYGDRAIAVGSGFENNPSPGNIKDGLITDAIKSAGAAKKGGTSPVTGVLDYTEPVTKSGLHLLCTPGNDVESTTGLAASGANLIVFTTGLGTPTGNPVVPVVKLSSNNALTQKMRDVIDLNAGTIIDGDDTVETKGEEILEYLIEVASGEEVPHAVRLGQDDFIPWKRGISL